MLNLNLGKSQLVKILDDNGGGWGGGGEDSTNLNVAQTFTESAIKCIKNC